MERVGRGEKERQVTCEKKRQKGKNGHRTHPPRVLQMKSLSPE